jgi:hypothetical protein
MTNKNLPHWMEQFKSLLPIFALIAVGTGVLLYDESSIRSFRRNSRILESLKEDNTEMRKLINKKDRKK